MSTDNHVGPDYLETSLDSLILKRTPVGERTATVDIETDAGTVTVTVRGVSRADFLEADKRFGEDEAGKERFLLSRCMVDPKLAPENVAQWQKISGPLEINKVQMKINEISGIQSGADKSSVVAVSE